jgi:hypothetical protein
VEAADPRLAAALEAALQGQAAEMLAPRRTLVLQGPPDATGRMDVLLGGPAWSASHRARVAEDGTVRLETWAHVRNGTGLPWENVRLVLLSGQARAIAVPLSIPRLPPRTPPEPARADAGPGPARAPMAAPLAGGQARARQSLADSATAEAAPAPPPADMLQGQPAGAVFRLATPLTLPDGALATLALAAETPEGGVVRSIRAGGASVEVGLRLRRGAGPDLPPGVLTATQGGGHLGDALLPPWPGGEIRRVALGTDPAIVSTDRRETRLRGQAAWAASGVLHLLSDEETRLRAEIRNARAEPVTIDFWTDLPPEATVLSGHAEGPGRAATTETLPPQARGRVEIAWRTPQRWSTPALDADPAEIRRRLADAPADAPGIADAMAWASRLEARLDLAARLADADRRIQRLAQGISPERERTARLLAGAEQAEALAALAQAARTHAQAVAQRDRLGTEMEALDAALRRDGASLAFGAPP